jgi:hypothetical protein
MWTKQRRQAPPQSFWRCFSIPVLTQMTGGKRDTGDEKIFHLSFSFINIQRMFLPKLGGNGKLHLDWIHL